MIIINPKLIKLSNRITASHWDKYIRRERVTIKMARKKQSARKQTTTGKAPRKQVTSNRAAPTSRRDIRTH